MVASRLIETEFQEDRESNCRVDRDFLNRVRGVVRCKLHGISGTRSAHRSSWDFASWSICVLADGSERIESYWKKVNGPTDQTGVTRYLDFEFGVCFGFRETFLVALAPIRATTRF